MRYNKILMVLAACSAMAGANAETITVSPGSLSGLMPQVSSDSELVIKGKADVRDLMSLSSLPSTVKKLDLSELEISEFSSTQPVWEDRSYFAANELPCYIFFKSPLQEIVLPGTLLTIGDGAFAGAEITSIRLPEKLMSIGSHAFYDCQNLKKIAFDSSLSAVGDWAFAKCGSLKEADMSRTQIAKLPDRCFINCTSLDSVALSLSTSEIGKEVFSGTAIQSLDLQNVMRADAYALVGMQNLQEVSLNERANLGEGLLMANQNLRKISGMPIDMPGLFAANCSNLVIDNKLDNTSTLGKYSLAGTQAGTVVLGSELTNIDRGAFKGLSNLVAIDTQRLGSNVPATAEDTFIDIDKQNVKLYVEDDAAKEAWSASPAWKDFNFVVLNNVNVDKLTTTADISMGVVDGQLKIIADEPISLVEVYSVDGRLMLRATPHISQFATDVNTTENMIIVSVSAAGKTKTVKVRF